MFMLGPTADLQADASEAVDKAEIVRQLLLLVDGTVCLPRTTTFRHVPGRGSPRASASWLQSEKQLTNFAQATKQLGLGVSIESGGPVRPGRGPKQRRGGTEGGRLRAGGH